ALLQASAILLGRHDLPTILQEILNIAQEILAADAYALWRRMERSDRWQIEASRGLSAEYIDQSGATYGDLTLAQKPMLLDHMHRDPRLEQRMDKLIAEGIAAMGAFPIHINHSASATLVFYYRAPHHFTPEELDYASIVANLAGAAIANGELIRAQQDSTTRSEILARVTYLFNTSLDFDQTAQAVAHAVVPALADWCSLSLYEEGKLNHIAVAHQDPAQVELANEFIRLYPERLDPERGALKVILSGEPQLVTAIPDEALAAAATDARHLELLRALSIWSYIVVPLRLAGRSTGILRLVSSRERPELTQADLQFAQEIAARAAHALENARLHREQTVLAQNLERERTFLSLAQRASIAGSWEVDLTTDPWTVAWSRNLEEIYGLEPGTFPGYQQAWIDRLHPDDRDRAVRAVEEAIASRTPLQHDFRIVRPDGEVRWISGRGQCTYAENGSPRAIIGINLDITDRRAAEAALMRSEKLSSAGRLAATIAHEINNPLEAVTNLLFLARNSASTQKDRFLEDADRELQRIAHITRQTLGFYRESTAPRQFALDQTIREVVSLLSSLFTRRESEPVLDLQPLTIEAVEGEIRQLLSNLVSNALDASPLGAPITMRLRKSWIRRGGGVHRAARISVADHGSGIPPSQLSRIFEPFFTTKKDIGTGLGLWVAREIATKHSGRIQVRSKPGLGSVVSVLLPVSQDPLE
ncbi:MAG TPA: GAF domain-containing protein, partial [Terracidiphilus sp.]|nr:GAF domain-containing protein [Terracidiphilus sp.]